MAPLAARSLSGLRSHRRGVGLVAILAATAAYGWLVQGESSPALSHYSLVRALADGTPMIDETRFETGPQSTRDVAFVDGHAYSNKAPGFALVALPAYVALDSLGVRTHGDPKLMLWALTLVAATLPACLLLLLVRYVGDELEPDFGTPAAVALGLGTLLTTFATVFFAHALSALLVFTAFVLLFVERAGASRLGLVAGAGFLAGYAVTTEYQNVLGVLVLGLYGVARTPRLQRGLVYTAGFAAGVAPLLLYNLWAFGSVMHFSYEGSLLFERSPGDEVVYERVQDAIGLPSVETFVRLLLSKWGLIATAPVLAAGVAGAVILFRRGRRAEVLVIGGIALAYVLFISTADFDPFGQVPPGPRYLVTILPFLAVPLAVSFRAFPAPSLALAAASVAVAGVVTATRPHIAWDGRVLYRLTHPSWWSPTVVDLIGEHAWFRIVPFVATYSFAVVCALLAVTWPPVSRRALLGAGLGCATWVALSTQGFRLLESGALGPQLGSILLLCALAPPVAAVVLLARPRSVNGRLPRRPTSSRSS